MKEVNQYSFKIHMKTFQLFLYLKIKRSRPAVLFSPCIMCVQYIIHDECGGIP